MDKPSLILNSPYLQWLLAQVFPRLREWPLSRWPDILTRARRIDFDRIEQIATLAIVVLFAWQIKPAISLGLSSLVQFLSQLAVMTPLALIFLAPFFVRRIRRGLEIEARTQDVGNEQGARDGNV